MDPDSMLHHASAHFNPAEPIRFHGSPGFSSSGEELSSDSSQENLRRRQILGGSGGNLAIEEDDDSYEADVPSNERFSNNSGYGAAASAYAAGQPKRSDIRNSSLGGKDINRQVAKPWPGSIRYHECMKNHAASLGGHAVDGCGEFLACGEDGFDALMCSVCGCHRNFHRRGVEVEHMCTCKRPNAPVNTNFKGVYRPATPGLLSIPTSRDLILHSQANLATSPCGYVDDTDLLSDSLSRKRRHRTKFSSEQKDRMFSLAEYLGWRIVKENDTFVQQFCDEIGVKRSVFKVWMHNNKNNGAKRTNFGESAMVRKYECPSDY